MKNTTMILYLLILLCTQISLAQVLPHPIFYALNISHSRSWTQVNKDGVIGITYFQHFDNNNYTGALIYRTIQLSGAENLDTVTTGTRLEKSVLLFDSLAQPHIFVAISNDTDQIINHYFKSDGGQWQSDIIIHFNNEGGKFIYELSADIGPDYSFHLLILKTRSDVDSYDYLDAWINSYLYHLTNASGLWKKELILNYNTAYTFDHHIKSSSRQDIKVDGDGYVHVIFDEQVNGNSYPDPSRLRYATNKTGSWAFETALSYDVGTTDEAGWFASLCLDNFGIPYISCMYKKRFPTGSAIYCKLLLQKRRGHNNWSSETIADSDDGYFGNDGHQFTGGISHLIFDKNNTPHIVFSDIASSHWSGHNYINVGNIRYGIFKEGRWNIETIYQQSLPTGFFSATEMYGLCLVVSDKTDTIRFIGQELQVFSQYQYSSKLIILSFKRENLTEVQKADPKTSKSYGLNNNFPNPFNSSTVIQYQIPDNGEVVIRVYDISGKEVGMLFRGYKEAGEHQLLWNAERYSSGVYLIQLQFNSKWTTKKVVLMK
jgi:Secretion system C-terminal sorting domain